MTLKEQSTGGYCFNLKLYNTMPVVMGNLIGKSRSLFYLLNKHCINFGEIAFEDSIGKNQTSLIQISK